MNPAPPANLTELLIQAPQRALFFALNAKGIEPTRAQEDAAIFAESWRRSRRHAFKGIVPLAEAARLHPATREALR